MSKYKQIKLAGITTISIKNRKSKVTPKDFARVVNPGKARLSEFVDALPRILMSEELRHLAADVATARRKKKPVVLMMGAHVIKVGLAPIIIDLVERGLITHVAMNSAAAIHDVETAMWGQTSEDVAVNILDGRFGMSRETGEFINRALVRSFSETSEGYGETLAKKIIAVRARFRDVSILASCYERNVPVTVHAAIGTDIIHQQPSMDGAATGEMSFRDFKILANSVKDLRGGGVVLNVGSVFEGSDDCAKPRLPRKGILHRQFRHDSPVPSPGQRRRTADAIAWQGILLHRSSRNHDPAAGCDDQA